MVENSAFPQLINRKWKGLDMANAAAKRLEALLSDPSHPRHGTLGAYNDGCRCDKCKEAKRESNRQVYMGGKDRYEAAKPTAQKYDVCTVSDIYLPMMGKPSIDNIAECCAICGEHEAEKRSVLGSDVGKVVFEGRELKRPTVRLCEKCHGLAQMGRLHFRWVETESQKKRSGGLMDNYAQFKITGGHWEYLTTRTPCDYLTALKKRKWKRIGEQA